MKALLLMILLIINSKVFALDSNKKNESKASEIVEKYIPKEFYQLRYQDSDGVDGDFITKEDITSTYVILERKNENHFYISAAYWASTTGHPGGSVCRVKLIKVENGKPTLMPKIKFKPYTNIENWDCEVFSKDIDGDGKGEVFVVGYKTGQIILKMSDKGELIDVSPDTDPEEGREFSSLIISDVKLDGRPILIQDWGNNRWPPKDLVNVYVFKDKFVKIGSYAEYFLIKKEQLDSGYRVTDDSNIEYPAYAGGVIDFEWAPDDQWFKSSGKYIMEIKNLSKHKYAVRAEVFVNGVKVLSPEDFCYEKPDKVYKKDEKNKIVEDDEDDKNEDKLKRCKAKNYVKTDVNMRAGKNEIKLRIFGKKDSLIQLTLNKK